mmetsp:Transcript_82465/g.163695  ORF Transcript_82465/g.163695 Transcript_82465/m.163695 type:complete len:808 (-) Transcript_82465:404-2827(-)
MMLSRLLKRKEAVEEPNVKEESKPSDTCVDPDVDEICKQLSEDADKLPIKKTGCYENPSPTGSETTYSGTPSMGIDNLGDASWNPSELMNNSIAEHGKKATGSYKCPKISEIAEDVEAEPPIAKEEDAKVLETATGDKVEDLMRAAGSVAATTAAAAAAANLVTQQRLDQKEVAQQSAIAGVEIQSQLQQQNTIEEKDADSPLFRAPPGLSEVVSLPSRGSGTHGTGDCSPCVWHWKPQGCLRGRDCGYCHLCPEGEVKARKKAKVATLRSTSSMSLGGGEAIQEKDQNAPPDQDAEVSKEARATPTAEAQALLSIGSSTHGTGQCRPCAWFWKPQGCQNGADCRHCHLCREGEIKARKKLKAESLRIQPDGDSSDVQQEAEEQPEDDGTAAISPPPGLAEPETPQATDGGISVGSTKHGGGECRPCAWFWKPQGCRNGADCCHCHLCPAGELKVRKKEKADTLRQERVEEQQAQEHACAEMMQFHQAMNPFCLPMVPPAPLPSLGSALHGTGMCRPCAWFWKPQGCGNGMDCCHCHLCPEGEIKARRKMKVAVMRHHGPKDQSPMMTPMSAMSPLGMFWDPKWQTPVHGDSFFMEEQDDEDDEQSEKDEEEEGEEKEEEQEKEKKQKEEKERTEAVEKSKEDGDDKEKEEKTAEGKSGEQEMEQPDNTKHVKVEIQAKEQDTLAPELNGEETPLFADVGMLSPFAFPTIPAPMTLPLTAPVEVALPSTGSALHDLGKCRPCAWMWKAKGCLNGEACAHCHLCPEGELKVRKKVKETAMRMGALVPSRNGLDARSPRIVKLAAGLEA